MVDKTVKDKIWQGRTGQNTPVRWIAKDSACMPGFDSIDQNGRTVYSVYQSKGKVL